MRIIDLIKETECITKKDILNKTISRPIRDHNKATSKDLFFLLPSVSSDERLILPKILRKKPQAIVVEDGLDIKNISVPTITVRSVRECYSYAMSRYCGINYGKLKIIGITGTNGKSTTAEYLKIILENAGNKCGLIGTGKILSGDRRLSDDTYTMTCPDSDILYPAIKQMEEDGCDYIIMEVSSHALSMKRVSAIPFDIGIFTGLSSEHMDFHKSMESYAAAKEVLMKQAKKLIINIDHKCGRNFYNKYKNKSESVGIIWQGNGYATDIENLGLEGMQYIYRTAGQLTRIRLKTPGIYNIYNSLMAIRAAQALGIKPTIYKKALESISCIEGRFELIKENLTVIIDYAHTPEALENLLKTVKLSKNKWQKIILVFGCGGDRDKAKRPVMASIAEKYADKIIITQDNSRSEPTKEIIDDITSGFTSQCYGIIINRKNAIEYAINTANENDYVVIAGKGHEKYIIDDKGTHYFDEKEIVYTAMKERKERQENL